MLAGFESLQSPDVPPEIQRKTLDYVVQLYATWDAAEPGTGKAEQASRLRAKAEE
jgi:hypothetical protein